MKRTMCLGAVAAVALSFGGCTGASDGNTEEATSESETAATAPIILVHGFAGFGPDEALGFRYWGGMEDLGEYLTNQGHVTKTAVVGPFSSNWDRAIELYYQIKGGCVDYGHDHSETFGHYRGRPEVVKCWHTPADPSTAGFPEALYPQWDARHPVHLMGHSMGGQTTKMLVHLLEADGAPLEPGLFGGVKTGWVKSVTAISASLNGTTLTNVATNYVPMIKNLVAGVAAFVGVADENNSLYNFKFEQWGLKRNEGEKFLSYRDRVMASKVWNVSSNKDISLWSLSREGASEENAWVNTWSNVYYFSQATRATYTLGTVDLPYASANMLVGLFCGLGAMGNYGKDQSWHANDCVVNTVSMAGPSGSTVVKFTGTPQRGKWNSFGVLEGFDHFDVTHWPSNPLTLRKVSVGKDPVGPMRFWSDEEYHGYYLEHADRLSTLR